MTLLRKIPLKTTLAVRDLHFAPGVVSPFADDMARRLSPQRRSSAGNRIANSLHGYAEDEAIDNDLTIAGFTDAIYTTVELPFAAASAHDVATGYCLRTPLRSELEARTSGDIGPVVEAAAMTLRKRFGSSAITTTMRTHIVFAAE